MVFKQKGIGVSSVKLLNCAGGGGFFFDLKVRSAKWWFSQRKCQIINGDKFEFVFSIFVQPSINFNSLITIHLLHLLAPDKTFHNLCY